MDRHRELWTVSAGTRIDQQERREIVEALETGISRNKVAKLFNRAQGSITAIAQEAGVSSRYGAPMQATLARSEKARVRRVKKLQRVLEKIDNASDFLTVVKSL